MIVSHETSPQVRQTAQFLNSKGVNVTCVEFAVFQAEGGERLISQEVVVGAESRRSHNLSSEPAPFVNEESFLASLDDNGRAVFTHVLSWSKENSMPIVWGTKGFSSNVLVDDVRVSDLFWISAKLSVSSRVSILGLAEPAA